MRILTHHREILTPEQVQLLGVVKEFDKRFGLVGGTAVALQIGHRESIDFDLFTKDPTALFTIKKLLSTMRRYAIIEQVIRDRDEELTLKILGVQFTFFHFPHVIPYTVRLRGTIDMPDLLTLAAMKAYALGQRSKWKDYVDLYFILREHHSLDEIAAQAKELFRGEFNERLFRQQLPFFEDVSYKEKVTFKPGFDVSDDEIKRFLQEASVS